MLATDRCDQCGAQAYTMWERRRDLWCLLTFCGHCTARNEAELRGSGFVITIDDRALLLAHPEPV